LASRVGKVFFLGFFILEIMAKIRINSRNVIEVQQSMIEIYEDKINHCEMLGETFIYLHKIIKVKIFGITIKKKIFLIMLNVMDIIEVIDC